MIPLNSSTDFSRYRFNLGKEQSLHNLFKESDLILLDSSALSIEYSICRDLYDPNTPSKIDKLIPILSSQLEYMSLFLDYVKSNNNIKTIDLIASEIISFKTIFNNSYTYHLNLWQKNVRNSHHKSYLPQKTHQKERKRDIRSLRAHNQRIKKGSNRLNDEYNCLDFDQFLPYNIKLLENLNSICQQFTQQITLYDGPIITIPSIGKSSPSDCALVGAALGKSAEQYNSIYQISILTKDFDIPRLFYNYIYTDQIYFSLFSNISIYMPTTQDNTLFQKIVL